MKKILKFSFCVALLSAFVGAVDSFAAKRQSALHEGTKVRTKIETSSVYDQECYEAYYGCMDQFCIVDNEMGGSCNCSDEINKYESALDDIKAKLAEAERIRTEEVEKVQVGANADIIFQGERKYDEKGNVIATKATKDKEEIKKSMWSTSSMYDSDEDEEDEDDEYNLFGKTGNELYTAAHNICKKQVDSSCDKDMKILTQMYSRNIVSDCKGLANSIEQKQNEAKAALNDANKAVRSALRDSFKESNKYDRGTCMVEYRNCMLGEDACGSDWGNCVFTIASENMQNNEAKSVKGTKVKTVKKYDITPSTMEILESKRHICERVLDSCVAVRDFVWDDFLREAAPTIHLAELNVESKKRQVCLNEISNCIQHACQEDIAGKGTASMDACLSRPDMARSFCKVQIEPCERMDATIWDYVVTRLAALRVDACTNEVKECLYGYCGEDYSKCIGLNTETIADMCPEEKLVACMKDGNIDTVRDYIARVARGVALQIDNDMATVCQNALNEVMVKICGDTESCDKFAIDEGAGTRSFKYEICRYDSIVGNEIKWTADCRSSVDGILNSELAQPEGKGWAAKLSGIMYWGDIEYKKNAQGVYDFTTSDEYIQKMIDAGQHITADDRKNVADLIYGVEIRELENSIKRTISAIESDPDVKYCMTGRQVEGFDGKKFGKKGKQNARFPNLTNNIREIIAVKALKVARENYNQKYDEEIMRMMSDQAKMGRISNLDEASKLCADWAKNSTLPASQSPKASAAADWVAAGLMVVATVAATVMTAGAGGFVAFGKAGVIALNVGKLAASATVMLGAKSASNVLTNMEPVGKANMDQWNYKMNVTTMFNRETGECTKITVTQNCKKSKKNFCQEWADAVEKQTTMKLL